MENTDEHLLKYIEFVPHLIDSITIYHFNLIYTLKNNRF